MIKAFFGIVVAIFNFFWQGVLFLWLALHTLGDWSRDVVHSSLKASSFMGQLVLFAGSILFSPFPWWTAFIFMFIPMFIAMPLLIIFFIMFILSFAINIVFI